MKILMDFLILFGINVKINENRGVLRPPPPKGWCGGALRFVRPHCHNFKFYYS